MRAVNRFSAITVAGLLAVFVASFGDEVAAITYAFTQVYDASMQGVSLLMSFALAGGLTSGPLSMVLLARYSPVSMLLLTLFGSGLIVIASSFYLMDYSLYIASFLLGSLGAMFWIVLSVIIPEQFSSSELIHVNKYVHSVKHSGHIAGPAIAGGMNASFDISTVLIVIGVVFLLAACCVRVLFSQSKMPVKERTEKSPTRFFGMSYLIKLIDTGTLNITLPPVLLAVCATSIVNVALIYILMNTLGYSESMYGFLLTVLCFGLVAGPLAFASFMEKAGLAVGACLCALVIGMCIVFMGLYQGHYWLVAVLFIYGIANGLQNTLMSTYVMAVIPEKSRATLIPVYMILIQLALLLGFALGGVVAIDVADELLIVTGQVVLIAALVSAAIHYRRYTQGKML